MFHIRNRPRRPLKAIAISTLKTELYWFFVAVTTATAFYLILVLGFHAWQINYWPRFTPLDVVSDLIWLLFATLIWVGVLTAVVLGIPLMVANFMPGSIWNQERRGGTTYSKDGKKEMSLGQLAQLTALWCGCPLAIEFSRSNFLPPETLQSAIFATCMFTLMLVWTSKEDRGGKWTGPTLKHLRQVVLNTHPLQAGVSVVSLFFLTLFTAAMVGAPGLIYWFATAKFAAWFIAGFSLGGDTNSFDETGRIFVTVGAFIVGSFSALVLTYGLMRSYWSIFAGIVSLCIFGLLFVSTNGLLEMARIGNVKRATIVYDAKLNPLVEKLTTTQQLGAHAVARVDVIFLFGADVVVAEPGGSSKRVRCDFSWLAQPLEKSLMRPQSDSIRCLALPRSAVLSVT